MCTHVQCTFLLQNGALWDVGPGIVGFVQQVYSETFLVHTHGLPISVNPRRSVSSCLCCIHTSRSEPNVYNEQSFQTWATWRRQSTANRLFVHQLVRSSTKENITGTYQWRETTCGRWFPVQRANDVESVCMTWRHHESQCVYGQVAQWWAINESDNGLVAAHHQTIAWTTVKPLI